MAVTLPDWTAPGRFVTELVNDHRQVTLIYHLALNGLGGALPELLQRGGLARRNPTEPDDSVPARSLRFV